MFRHSCVSLQTTSASGPSSFSTQFFNPRFFRAKVKHHLTPRNTISTLKNSGLPMDARVHQKWKAMFVIANDKKALGMYAPPLCLPYDTAPTAGGRTLGEYITFLEENIEHKNVFVTVTTGAKLGMGFVECRTGETVGKPKSWVAVPNDDQYISIDGRVDNDFFDSVFEFLSENQENFEKCSVLLKRNFSDERNWLNEVFTKQAHSEELKEILLLDRKDPRWLLLTASCPHGPFDCGNFTKAHVLTENVRFSADVANKALRRTDLSPMAMVGATRQGELLIGRL